MKNIEKRAAKQNLRSEKNYTQKYFSLHFICRFYNDLFRPLAVAFCCLKKNLGSILFLYFYYFLSHNC